MAAAYKGRYLIVFGGGSVAHCFNDLHVLDTETMEWSQPPVEGEQPSARAGEFHALYAAAHTSSLHTPVPVGDSSGVLVPVSFSGVSAHPCSCAGKGSKRLAPP